MWNASVLLPDRNSQDLSGKKSRKFHSFVQSEAEKREKDFFGAARHFSLLVKLVYVCVYWEERGCVQPGGFDSYFLHVYNTWSYTWSIINGSKNRRETDYKILSLFLLSRNETFFFLKSHKIILTNTSGHRSWYRHNI